MPPKKLPMNTFREILRLRHDRGLPQRAIARACGVALGSVAGVLHAAEAAGLAWPLPDHLDDTALEVRLGRAGPGLPASRPLPDFAYVHAELRRTGVTLQLLWEEYFSAHPDGYRYTQFCEHYNRFARRLSPVMRQTHRAGEKGFVDFSGKRPVIFDRHTGAASPVELLVGVLGASNYTYAEATLDQSLPCWIDGHVRMFEFFGGVPAVVVPDNLKSGVTTSSRYEPVPNRTYAELAAHYGAVIVPARPNRPRDKAKVEVAVQVAQRWILAKLRNQKFFDIGALNEAIRRLLDELNDRQMKHLGASRRQLFEQLDHPALLPLPRNRYELAVWKQAKVNIDYHAEFDRNFYSVPHTLVGERVEVRATSVTVELFFRSRRIASHVRLRGRGHAATTTEHMPRSHREHARWTPSRIIGWAATIGPSTEQLVVDILDQHRHPEHGFRRCLGIIRLAGSHGNTRVEAASARAVQLGSASYMTVRNILQRGLDTQPLDAVSDTPVTLPAHENVRGAGYYEKEDRC